MPRQHEGSSQRLGAGGSTSLRVDRSWGAFVDEL